MIDYGKISIIIPAYNAEQYIEKCVKSVINQTYKNIEVIIVDDGSKDNTFKIVDLLKSSDNRICLIHQENAGPSTARNTGLKKADGKYILFLDADDWLEKNCCEYAVIEHKKNKADIVFFDYYREYKNKTVQHHRFSQNKVIYNSENRRSIFLYDMKTITPWGKLYTRKCIANEIFDEKMKTAEDVDFNYRVYQKVEKAVFISNCLLHYRILQNSAVHGYDANVKQKFEYPIKTIRKYMLNDNSDCQKAYYSFAAIAYILICQNGIFLDKSKGFSKKMRSIKELNKNTWVKELFKNTSKIQIPLSRKIIILFGKLHISIGILTIILIKQKAGK